MVKPCLKVLAKLVLLLKVRGHRTTLLGPPQHNQYLQTWAPGYSCPCKTLGAKGEASSSKGAGKPRKVQRLHLLRTQKGGCNSLGSAASALGCKRPRSSQDKGPRPVALCSGHQGARRQLLNFLSPLSSQPGLQHSLGPS